LLVAKIARVSNPANEGNAATAPRLVEYLIRHRHWSPFEMVSACIEISTTRDIARQLLRHRSFSFQEFSQRYAAVDALPPAHLREARMQDVKNRQNSTPCDDVGLAAHWRHRQRTAHDYAMRAYQWAIDSGIAKEVARAVLPEGLTTSRLYMAGTLRSWLHFCDLRRGPETQLETRQIADAAWRVLRNAFPQTCGAWEAVR
jgi:thymidylate synthase (FAD)